MYGITKYLLGLLIIPMASFTGIPVNKDFIYWDPGRKLTWADYLASPVEGTDAVASTATHLGFEYSIKDNDLSYNITCAFIKSKSWGKRKTPYILAHEQGHFDIAEIHARLLNKRLNDYRFNSRTFKTDLQRIYNEVIQQKESFQEQYDRETNHSINHDKQETWLIKITGLLNETRDYAVY